VSGGPAELLYADAHAAAADEAAFEIEAASSLRLVVRRLRKDPVTLIALVVVIALALAAILAPWIVKLAGAHSPNAQNVSALDEFGDPRGPGHGYLFGTDDLGRDVFSRTLYGARSSLEVTLIATALITIIGVALGMIAGYYRGWIDTVLSRAFDVALAFPVLLLALGLGAACSFGNGCVTVNYRHLGFGVLGFGVLVAVLPSLAALRYRGASRRRRLRLKSVLYRALPGLVVAALAYPLVASGTSNGALIRPGLPVVIFIITLAGVPYMGRIVRGQVLSLREREFVEALRALGASNGRILFSHILPNLVAPILVFATILIPQNVLLEAALSFLGIGVQPPTADWGAMIAAAVSLFKVAWWYMTFPGLALLLTVLAFNLVGDGLQDALAPKEAR
jgi:ABC-type dipeptide/oligopeptide/nickel transport system permease subunit